MFEESKNIKNTMNRYPNKESIAKEASALINWFIYSYDGQSIGIHTNSNLKLENTDHCIDEVQNKDNQIISAGSIIDINRHTKCKSSEEIKEIITNRLITNQSNYNSIKFKSNIKKYVRKEIDNKSSSQSNDDNDILDRNKYSKLTLDQMKMLSSKIKESKYSISELSRIYWVSRTTLTKIKNADIKDLKQIQTRNFSKTDAKTRRKLAELIENFDQTHEYPYWAKDVQNYLDSEINILYPIQLIRDIMKCDVKLSYKRCSSRPTSVDLSKVKLLRKLFWINFIEKVDTDTLIANCDEWAITRNTKQNYSWSKISSNKEILNASFSGIKSLIMTIFSNGWWFLLISNSTTNSMMFEYYLNKLNCWILANYSFGYTKFLLTLDNWSYHKGKCITELVNRFNWNVIFLPVYSPSLAPIELAFGLLKKFISNKLRGKRLNLQAKGANQTELNEMKELTWSKICSLFKHFTKK